MLMGSICYGKQSIALPVERKRDHMKNKNLISCLIAALVLTSATLLVAQNGPKGRGYGGPPANDTERTARQQACPSKGTNCPAVCPNEGGMGKGAGCGFRRGLCDGTGPRNGTGTCPVSSPKSQGK